MKERNPFYLKWAWKKVRNKVLARDHYECQICKEKGKYSKGEIVHHIKFLEDYPELAYDTENLITVCRACHMVLHGHTTRYAEWSEKKRDLLDKFPERW